MFTYLFRRAPWGALLLAASLSAGAQDAYRPPVAIAVGKAAALADGGRLLLIAQKAGPAAEAPPAAVDANPFAPQRNFVAAREVGGLRLGDRLAFHPGDLAAPVSIDRLPPGDYWVQAVLDADHSYAYSMRGPGDVVSQVARLTLPRDGAPLVLQLDTVEARPGPWEFVAGRPMFDAATRAVVEARLKTFSHPSAALSAFSGRPVHLQGYVFTPEGYENGDARYPVVYMTHGYQVGMQSLMDSAVGVLRQTGLGQIPPMIWVFLDQSGPTGTHEFADSVNNGPWGTAQTRELLPEIDRRYRTDGAAGRFFIGHSSGGWAALWQALNEPALFRAVWATSPDYTDFTDFAGIDITAPGARFTDLGRAQMEEVLGAYGGQESSFDWVFSPRGADGRPLPMYDRRTGLVDPVVARYWRERWDLSQIARKRWPALRKELDGKIHVVVGEEDQYRLQVSARKLQAAIESVGGKASFTYVPGKDHYNLYSEGGERMALRRKIAWQMWKLARPGSALADPGPPKAP